MLQHPTPAACDLTLPYSAGTNEPQAALLIAAAQIAGKRWKIDLNSRQEAGLLISAVNLPGGVQVRDFGCVCGVTGVTCCSLASGHVLFSPFSSGLKEQ